MSSPEPSDKPILAVDVDGVISLFGFDEPPEQAPCTLQLIDGMAHCISFEVGERLQRLIPYYDMVWATGWEDRANDYLLHLLGLQRLPVIRFGSDAAFGSAHWKLEPIASYANGRGLAWIDDSLDDECHEWAANRAEPTLLVPTESARGLENAQVEVLIQWAQAQTQGTAAAPG
jgi:HAD domain in Swiss Army Knife RNA repair proteins